MGTIKLNVDRSFFNEKYIPYLKSEHRYNVFYGGSSSGKSYFVATKLILDLLQKKKKLLVVRQTFASINETVFTEIKKALIKMEIVDLVKISKTTLKITFPNGSEIIFKGADDESKLLSMSGIDICWVEEASELSKELFNQLELRLRGLGHKKQFYLTFNPISSLHWLKSEFFDMPKKDSAVCHSTYLDNAFLMIEDIEQFEDMRIRNPQKYEVYALGKWGTTGKKVFTNWKIKEFEVHEIVKTNPLIKSALGMDFGYVADASTLICSLVDLENRKLYIFDEMYEHGLLNNELAQRIIEMGYSKEKIVADSSEKKSIAEINSYGVPRIQAAKKGAGSVMSGIQFMQQFEIIIHPKCKHTIDEFENYSFKKDKTTGQYLNQPIDKYNHCITGDTLVNTVQGSKPISELVGTLGSVFCFDEMNQKPAISNYFDVRMTRENAEIYELVLENGKKVRATGDHLILTRKGWIELADLTPEDEVIDINLK